MRQARIIENKDGTFTVKYKRFGLWLTARKYGRHDQLNGVIWVTRFYSRETAEQFKRQVELQG